MDFQSGKSFGKLGHRALQLYHQILCILKHVEDVEDRSSTPMGCNAMYVEDIKDRKNLPYTQNWMLWLKRPGSQLSKTFFGLKIRWILRKLWAKTCWYTFWASFEAFDQLFIFITIFDTFDMKVITWPLILYWDTSHLRHLRHEYSV